MPELHEDVSRRDQVNATFNLFEDTNPHELKELLGQIHSREMALPDFQRNFVWRPDATQELIISIANGFPAGSLLRIRNTANLFRPRAFEGAPNLDGKKVTYLILDGQQRLTSLYQAFYGVGEHQYFINLKVLADGGDFEDAVFHLRSDHYRTTKLLDPLSQAEDLILPLRVMFGERNGFLGWVMRMTQSFQDQGKSRELQEKLLRAGEWHGAVDDYKFPVVTLTDRTKPEAVCTIFETLNRTGVKLSVFELLTARFWSQDVNLRDLWRQAVDTTPLIKLFDPDPYYILQAAALLRPGVAPSCKRSAVLKLGAQEVAQAWDNVIWGFREFLGILKEECGICLPTWVPYGTMLVPAAAIAARLRALTGPESGAARRKIVRWFWCAVFGQAYENSPNSQSALDVREVGMWLSGGATPSTIRNFRFDPQVLRRTTPRQWAVYSGAMALVMRQGPRDFHKGKRIDGDVILRGEADDHHIFPSAILKRQGIEDRIRDSILNRTLIDRATNIRIQATAPSEYFGVIRGQLGSAFGEVLASHLLPRASDDVNPLTRDDLEEFLTQRLALISEKIQEVTGAIVRSGVLVSLEAGGATPAAPLTTGEVDPPSSKDELDGPDHIQNGREVHQQRCAPTTWRRLERLVALILRCVPDAVIDWNQKKYIKISVRGAKWGQIVTYPNQLHLVFWTQVDCFDLSEWCAKLRVAPFDPSRGDADRPSSLNLTRQHGEYRRYGLRIRTAFDLENPELPCFIRRWREALETDFTRTSP